MWRWCAGQIYVPTNGMVHRVPGCFGTSRPWNSCLLCIKSSWETYLLQMLMNYDFLAAKKNSVENMFDNSFLEKCLISRLTNKKYD